MEYFLESFLHFRENVSHPFYFICPTPALIVQKSSRRSILYAEKVKVLTLHQERKYHSQITEYFDRSCAALQNYLKGLNTGRRKPRPGSNPKKSRQGRRRFFRGALKGVETALLLKKCGLHFPFLPLENHRTVWFKERIINDEVWV